MDVAENQPLPTWSKIQCPLIPDRACHSAVIMDDLLIGFAGWNGKRFFNDIVALNLTNNKWESVQLYGSIPTPRYTHTANLYKEDRIIIVGGFAGGIGVLKETAIIKMTSRNPLTFVWETLKTKGGEDLHRSDHTANILGNCLYLFGGADEEEQSTDELWMLDTNNFVWKKLNPTGNKPGDRYGHSSVIFNDSLYIFGGFTTRNGASLNDLWQINLKGDLKWQRIQTGGINPSGLYAASAKEIDGKIVLFGGQHRMGNSKDLHIFDTKTGKWEKVEAKGSPPEARSYYASAFYKNKYIIWGGEAGRNDCVSTLYQLEFPDNDGASSPINIQEFKQKEALNTLQRISQDNLFTDVVFEVEGQELSAHKAILAGSCRYFYNMFTSGMSEVHMNRIKVAETSACTFKAFLDFVYCRDIQFEYSLAIDLLGLGEKYFVQPLKELCEDFLTKVLTKQNVTELTNVAECFEAPNLKKAIQKFIKRN